ncbi:SET domain-containing protein SmydA-8 [Lucilia sericata]|uniref:SET domain-containing protein SmydA-8 n=1 Tax=Lucilia sericata TaxID=13632 RepID=UPI0018A7FB5A|nr:SET domain-containing protein SmydA-8 [Lucilia sericata]
MNPCTICKTETKNSCSNCKQVFYCCVEHQKQDWKNHKKNCHPYKIVQNEELGRHLITTRTIKPFEIILKEAPLFRGPSQLTPPVCLGCLNAIEPTDYINCEQCGWPLCGVECKNKDEHRFECELTVKRGKKVNVQEFTNPHPLYQCLSTARCLMLRDKDAEKWKQINELESLEDQRRGSMQWKADYESVCKFIIKYFNTQLFSEDEIMRIIGILQINGHEVPTSDPAHVGIFYNASFLEHSCTPNIAKSFNKDGHLVLWAPKEIKKGSHLSICYSDAVWGTADRQRHLMQTKIFKCQCPRCIDVTEYGTNYSALKCEKSECRGLMLPANLNDWHKDWTCKECKHQVDKTYVNNILERAGSDLNAMDKTKENCLKYLSHYGRWLPSHHYYMCEVKIHLVQQLGKEPQELMILPNEDLRIKLEYGRELVELYEKLAPCEVRMLGTLCFEVHSAVAENTRRISLETSLSPKELLEEALMYVEKSVNYLQYESDIFVEGHMLKQAKINRDALKMVIRM